MKRRLACLLAAVMMASCVPAFADDGIKVIVNGEEVVFTDSNPVIMNSRTMIPLRGVFEKLGANIFWKANTKTAVIAFKGGDTVRITVGEEVFYNGEKAVYSDVPATIIGGRMYLPVRAISEASGINVAWDSENKIVRVGAGALEDDNLEGVIPETEADIEAMLKDAFGAKILGDLADEFKDYAKTTKQAEVYRETVLAFLENEKVGLPEEYKKELEDIFEDSGLSLQALGGKLKEFSDKMEGTSKIKMERVKKIAKGAGNDFLRKMDKTIDEACDFGDLDDLFDEMLDIEKKPEDYKKQLDAVDTALLTVVTENVNEEKVLYLYTKLLEISEGYVDTVIAVPEIINIVD